MFLICQAKYFSHAFSCEDFRELINWIKIETFGMKRNTYPQAIKYKRAQIRHIKRAER
jgi:hypothetical protein